jgi:hypothetical protein
MSALNTTSYNFNSYLNGILTINNWSGAFTSYFVPGTRYTINFGSSGTTKALTNAFAGYMDEVQIYPYQLTQTLVTTLYRNPGLFKFKNYKSIYTPTSFYIDDFRFYNHKALTDNEVNLLYNKSQIIPAITNAYYDNVNNSSATIYFTGSYNSVIISRNGVNISGNIASPFVDTGLMPQYNYVYIITPYDIYLNAGTSYTLNLETGGAIGSGNTAIDNTGLMLYYPFDIGSIQGMQFGNYANGPTPIFDASMSNYALIDTSNNKIGSGSLILNSAFSQYVTLPVVPVTGPNGISFAMWFLANNTADYSRIFELSTGPGVIMII